MVTEGLKVRAYAGVPLLTSEGYAIGTLCAIDQRPRDFDERQLKMLRELADVAKREIQAREQAIRARHLADERLQDVVAREKLYQATFERAAIGIALVGLDGSWLRTNATICQILGRTAKELTKLTFQDITHPDDLDIDLGLVKQLFDGYSDHYTLEKRYIRPDSSIVWANLTVTLVSDEGGKALYFVSTIEDITTRRNTELALHKLRAELEERVVERTGELERANQVLADVVKQRQRSEDALAEREADLRAVLTHAHEGYVCTDNVGRVIEWNRQSESMFGWPRAEAIGRRIDELIIPLSLRERHRAGMHRLATTGQASVLDQRLELPACRKDGSVFPCEVSITALPSHFRGTVYAAFLRDISERREQEERIASANQTLEDLYENAPCGYYSLDQTGKFVQLNDMSAQLFGCSREELIGKRSPRDFFTEEGIKRFSVVYPKFMAEGSFGPEEFDLVAADGQRRRVSVSATALRDAAGNFVRSRTVIFDVTELHITREALQIVNRQQDLMLDNELFPIVKIRDRRIVWANKALENMLEYGPDELNGTTTQELYPNEDDYNRMGYEAYLALGAGQSYRTQLELLTRTGRHVWVDMSGVVLDKETGESLWMMLDITTMKHYQAEVEKMAYHDALTGLPNRMLLMDRLTLAIAAARRSGEHIAVCFGDLNGFKAVNDNHGHDIGDQLLIEVANRLSASVRSHDTVARLGGDEFVLVLTGLETKESSEEVLRRVISSIAKPVALLSGAHARVGISFGLAFSPEDGLDPNELIAKADERMYEQKKSLR